MKQGVLKASFIGSKESLRTVLDALKSTGAFQMTTYKKATTNPTDTTKYDELIGIKKHLDNAISIAQIKMGDRAQVLYNDLKSFTHYKDGAMRAMTHLENIQTEIAQIDAKVAYNRETIRGLGEYMHLPVAFNMVQDTKSVVILCGVMPTVQYHHLVRDFGSTKINIQCFPSGKTNRVVVVTAHRDDAEIANVIHSYDFVPCRYIFAKTAPDMIADLKCEIVDLSSKRVRLSKATQLNPEQDKALKYYYDYICNEVDTIDLAATTLQTERYYVLNGWVIETEMTRVQSAVKSVAPDVIAEFKTADLNDNAPVVLKNSKIVTPFRNITEMYGSPNKRDIDPNPFVAFFYFVFFGMMIGDVGYALVLCLAVAAFIYFKKPAKSTTQFLLLFGICGISALLWGIFFGSIFGFKIGTQVIDPLDGAIYVLLLSLFMGLIQMATGVTIDVWNKFRNGEYKKACIKGLPRVVLFAGLILWLPKMAFQIFGLAPVGFFDAIAPAGMWITIVGAVGTAATNPYSLVSYFNDTISYVRLFALALVGTVIATVGNTIGGMLFGIPVVGYPVGVIIACLFHLLNLGLGLISAYIHGARLQFIEFFSKFYVGDGHMFTPIGSNLKYTLIKGGNNQ